MTVREMSEVVGRMCSLEVVLGGSMRGRVFAEIADVRESYGRTDYLVRVLPVAGEGEAWVSAERVTVL